MPPADAARLRQALASYDQGRTAEAQPLLEQLLQRYPANYEINETLGLIHAEAGDYSAALPLLERGAHLKPAAALARANLGTAYLKLEQPEKALTELDAAARLDPHDQQTLINLATARMETRQPAKAAQAFAAAAAVGPLDAGTTHDRALALLQTGNAAEAKRVLDSVPAADRNDAVEAIAADTEERLGNYQQAAQHFSQAAHLNPTEPNIYAWVVELLRHFSWQPAEKVAAYGIEQFPDSLRMKAARGIAFYADNRYKESSAVFSALLAVQPDNATYAGLLGRSCALIQDPTATGCEGLERFAKAHPENAEAATYAATAMLHRPTGQRDDDSARALLQQAVAANPSLAEAYYQLGVLNQEQTRWQESTVPLEKAIALKPPLAEAHYRLARAYSHLGRREDAARQIELQQRYAKEEKESLDTRLKEVTTFLTADP
jgi:tetratricopeptide (TPR) repeat protein